jgi:hypothetical protein
MERNITKQQLLVEKKLLAENWIENTLMIAGFVPVIGEIADLTLIIYYCYKKEWLYAGLMLFALIPTVGDFIAKPLIRVFKSPLAKNALKSTDEMVTFLRKNPKVAEQYSKLSKYADNKSINKLISQVNEVSPTFARQIQTSLNHHKSVLTKLLERPKGIAKAVIDTGKIGGGMTKFFREEKLAQYILKKGHAPKTWLSNWYNITYLGNREKRQYIRNFIVANNLLSFLGIPNLTDFERRMSDPNELERFANNPEFSKMVNSTTSESDLAKIEDMDRSQESGDSGLFSGQLGMNFLKMMAQKYV